MVSSAEAEGSFGSARTRSTQPAIGVLGRLKAVAGSRYHPKNDELVLVSRKYREPHRNKADLRKTLGLLVEDAKANPIEKGGKGPHGNFFKVRQLAGRQKRKSAF